jgi:hypothetical protein
LNPHVVPFTRKLTKGLLPFIQDVIVQGDGAVSISGPGASTLPGLTPMIKKAHAIAVQTYSGDIAFIRIAYIACGKTFTGFVKFKMMEGAVHLAESGAHRNTTRSSHLRLPAARRRTVVAKR